MAESTAIDDPKRRPYKRAPVGIQPAAIVDAALDIIDREGLLALSMRRLSTELDVSAPALYWYFKDREALLDGVAARILWREPSEAAPSAEWRTQVVTALMDMRRQLLKHPNAVPICTAPSRLRAASGPLVADIIRPLLAAGLHGKLLIDGIQMLIIHLLGSVIVQTATVQALDLPWRNQNQVETELANFLLPDHPAGPEFVATLRAHIGAFSFSAIFEQGVHAILISLMSQSDVEKR